MRISRFLFAWMFLLVVLTFANATSSSIGTPHFSGIEFSSQIIADHPAKLCRGTLPMMVNNFMMTTSAAREASAVPTGTLAPHYNRSIGAAGWSAHSSENTIGGFQKSWDWRSRGLDTL